MNNFKKSDGATHIDNCGRYYKLTNTHKGFMLLNNDGDWDYCNPATELRLIADIKRIAELEKANNTLYKLMISGELRGVKKATEEYKTQIAELEKELATIIVGLFSEEELAIRDLEQQAKGVCDLAESMMFRGHLENTLDRTEVLVFAAELTKKAKALKEKGNE